MIKITVLDDQPAEKKGTFTDDSGKERAYTTRKQRAKWTDSDGYIMPYAVRLEDGQTPYAKGDYELAVDAMLTCDKEVHKLSKFTKLKPLQAAK